MDSILTSIKKMLGIEEDYIVFDIDIIIHINSVFQILQQMGVGPQNGFYILDKEAVWTDFTNDNLLIESVKSYMYLKVRMMFDPPQSGPLIDAMERIIKELEWRLVITSDKNNGLINKEVNI